MYIMMQYMQNFIKLTNTKQIKIQQTTRAVNADQWPNQTHKYTDVTDDDNGSRHSTISHFLLLHC